MWFLQSNLSFSDIIMRLLACVIIICVILPLHEYAHGFVAYKLGDKTAKFSGRLTINPLYHIDPIGALGILLFGFGWAKPVPVDPRNFKHPKSGMAITALAGPVSNLLAALIGGFLINIVALFRFSWPLAIFNATVVFLQYYISINIGLAVFNLIPIPPLDGSKILAAFLPDRIIYKYAQYQNIFTLILFALILLGFLTIPLSYMQYWIYKGIIDFTGIFF